MISVCRVVLGKHNKNTTNPNEHGVIIIKVCLPGGAPHTLTEIRVRINKYIYVCVCDAITHPRWLTEPQLKHGSIITSHWFIWMYLPIHVVIPMLVWDATDEEIDNRTWQLQIYCSPPFTIKRLAGNTRSHGCSEWLVYWECPEIY